MYRYQRFGTVNLPTGNVSQKIGSMGTTKSLVTVAGGAVFDSLGSDDAPSKPGTVTMTASLRGNGRDALETGFRELQALRGKVLKLYRAWEPSGRIEWIYARLMRVEAPAEFWFNGRITAVQMQWDLLDNVWNGDDHAAWVFEDGIYFDTGLDFDNTGLVFTGIVIPPIFPPPTLPTITVTNNGNTRVTSAKITIEMTSSTSPDNISIKKTSGTKTDCQFGAGINNGDVFVIDSTNSTITLNGSNVYSSFYLSNEHATSEWIRLEPGDNIFEFEALIEGANLIIDVTFEFADAWQ